MSVAEIGPSSTSNCTTAARVCPSCAPDTGSAAPVDV